MLAQVLMNSFVALISNISHNYLCMPTLFMPQVLEHTAHPFVNHPAAPSFPTFFAKLYSVCVCVCVFMRVCSTLCYVTEPSWDSIHPAVPPKPHLPLAILINFPTAQRLAGNRQQSSPSPCIPVCRCSKCVFINISSINVLFYLYFLHISHKSANIRSQLLITSRGGGVI